MTNEVIGACHEFYDVVGCIVHDSHSHELDAYHREVEMFVFLVVGNLVGMT